MNAPRSSLHTSQCLYASRHLRQSFTYSQISPFSSSAQRWPRGKKGTNRMRGLSAIRSSGNLNKIRSVRPETLPIPVMDPAKRAGIQPDEDHGLWGFFNKDRQCITGPEELAAHGRAWTNQELRKKNWKDLHTLWWKCHYESNRLSTEKTRRDQISPGYGAYELDERQQVVRETMAAIKATLNERSRAWEDAVTILNKGEEPDLEVSEDGQSIRWKARMLSYEEDEELEVVASKADLDQQKPLEEPKKGILSRMLR